LIKPNYERQQQVIRLIRLIRRELMTTLAQENSISFTVLNTTGYLCCVRAEKFSA
jgi:hypothetical protein